MLMRESFGEILPLVLSKSTDPVSFVREATALCLAMFSEHLPQVCLSVLPPWVVRFAARGLVVFENSIVRVNRACLLRTLLCSLWCLLCWRTPMRTSWRRGLLDRLFIIVLMYTSCAPVVGMQCDGPGLLLRKSAAPAHCCVHGTHHGAIGCTCCASKHAGMSFPLSSSFLR